MEQQMAVINIQAGEVFKANEDISLELVAYRIEQLHMLPMLTPIFP